MITYLKKKNFFAIKILIVLILLVSTGGFLFAWTAPTGAPTSGNTPPPIDISTTEQAKGNSNPLGALLRLAGSVTMQGLSVFNDGTGLFGLKVTSLSQVNNPGVTFTNGKAKICINAQHYLVLCGAPATTNPSLTVAVTGTGTGVVLSNDNPRTITCVSGSTSNCYKEYTNGTSLTLTAGETLGVFAGWGGDCVSAGTNQNCNITMTGNKTVSATFNPPGACSVTTAQVTNVTATTALSGGTITSTGGGVITAGGVEYGLVGSAGTQTAGGYSGSPTYTSVMSSLTPDQDYRVRAYAINSSGTCYGSWRNFTTLGSGSLPAISNPTATGMTQTSATLGANVTNVGNPTITLKGICYGTTANPTYPSSGSSTCISVGGMTTGPFTRTVTGLTAGTTYHFRGYAINTLGTVYTQDATFITTTGTGGGSCSVTTNAVTEITQTSAKANGTVTSGTNPYRGFVMNTSPNPTLENNWFAGGIFVPQPNTGTGAYSSQMGIPPFAPLQPGTTYYVRAFCNITGQTTTTYGENVSFTTSGGSGPTITTLAVTGIGQTSATGHGTVTLNGSTVTEKGLVWGRSSGPRTWDNCGTGGVCNKYMTSGGGGNIDSLMSKDMLYSLPTTLAPGTKYYVRAYAIVPGYGGYDPLHPTEPDANHKYGNQVEFTTTSAPCAHGSYVVDTVIPYEFNTASRIPGFPCTGTLDITISGSGGGGGGSAGAADHPTYRHSAGAGGGGGGGYISFKVPITSSNLSFYGLVGAGGAGGAGGEEGASPSANGSGGSSGSPTTMLGPGGINITAFGGSYGNPSTWECALHCMPVFGTGGAGGTVSGLSSLNNSFVLSGSVASSSGVSGSDGKFPCEYNDGGNGGNGFGGAGGRGAGTLEGGCGPLKHGGGEGGGSGASTGGGGGGGGSLGTFIWPVPFRHTGADGGIGGSGRVIISW